MIKEFGTGRVETLVAMKCRRKNRDRLSSGKGVRRRACCIEKYFRFVLADFHKDLYMATIVKMTVKLIYYWVHCLVIKLTEDKCKNA